MIPAPPVMLAALRRGLLVLLALVVVLAPARALAGDGVFEPLTIHTAEGAKSFQVEVMRTDEEHRRGMMFRRSLAPDHGMLFVFPTPQPATFWMQNTYVSLDMVFIKADGTVHRVEPDAEPLSTATIASGAPVLGVLELLAGTAARIGLRPGDTVDHAIFRQP